MGRRWVGVGRCTYKNAPWWPGPSSELLRYKPHFLPFSAPADLSKQLPQAILPPPPSLTRLIPPQTGTGSLFIDYPDMTSTLGSPAGESRGRRDMCGSGEEGLHLARCINWSSSQQQQPLRSSFVLQDHMMQDS